VQSELIEQRDEVAGPADRDGGRAERIFEDQIPPDHPGDELAERGVGVGVGGTGDRHRRGELGIAQGREHARQARQHHGEDDRGTGVGCRGLAGQNEDAGADDGADTQHDQLPGAEHALENGAPLSSLFSGDRFDGLRRKNGHVGTVSHPRGEVLKALSNGGKNVLSSS
jgi:hypothetical protein